MGLRDAYGPDETALGSDSRGLSGGSDAEPAGSEAAFAGRLEKPLDFMTVHKTVLTISITPQKLRHPICPHYNIFGFKLQAKYAFLRRKRWKKVVKVAILP